jgi:HTH-type transcriptional regulator/antitoxin HipB
VSDPQGSIKALGADVRERRRALGLLQEDLADLAGTSARFIGSLENGKPTVRLDKVVAVLDALGLELRAAVRQLA